MSGDTQAPILHASLIARRRGGRWAGVLLEGASGSGKSDLALRATTMGWRLVADDRVIAWRSGGRLFGRAPKTLAGLVEARGVGVLRSAALPFCEIAAVVACASTDVALERCPAAATRALLGYPLPFLTIGAGEASALAKLDLAMAASGV